MPLLVKKWHDLSLYRLHKPGISRMRWMAGVEGFEPSITGPKPDALPLGYTPRIPNAQYTSL